MTDILKGSISRLLVRMTKIKSNFDDRMAQKRIIRSQNKTYSRSPKKLAKEFELSPDSQAVKKVQQLIDSVSSGGPSGLPQLGALSNAIGRAIEVYDENQNLKYSIGETNNIPVKLEYHEPKNDQTTGHFTLLGGLEPRNKADGVNMCLYDVVGSQTGKDAQELKSLTLKIMKNHVPMLANQIDDIWRLENDQGIKLCMAGANYNGNSPRDAGRHLDDSNGIQGFGKDRTAHPRMHASVPNADPQTDCVEKYSMGCPKSGHDSRDEQDFVTHHALRTEKARRAMDKLNEYGDRAARGNPGGEEYIRQAVHITRGELSLPRDSGAGKWVNGQKTESWPTRDVLLVLQHHRGQEMNRDYPVHIQTAYPKW